MRQSLRFGFALMAIVAAACGCSLTSTITPTAAASQQPAAVNPVIQAVAPNPTAVAHKADVMTFTVTAYAPDGAVLDYTWSATKGYLSATKGQMVSWTPQKSDGTIEAGIGTIQVMVSNGKGGTAQASVNIQIAQDGSATKQ